VIIKDLENGFTSMTTKGFIPEVNYLIITRITAMKAVVVIHTFALYPATKMLIAPFQKYDFSQLSKTIPIYDGKVMLNQRKIG